MYKPLSLTTTGGRRTLSDVAARRRLRRSLSAYVLQTIDFYYLSPRRARQTMRPRMGRLRQPAMGLESSALASLVTQVTSVGLTVLSVSPVVLCHRHPSSSWQGWKRGNPAWRLLDRMGRPASQGRSFVRRRDEEA